MTTQICCIDVTNTNFSCVFARILLTPPSGHACRSVLLRWRKRAWRGLQTSIWSHTLHCALYVFLRSGPSRRQPNGPKSGPRCGRFGRAWDGYQRGGKTCPGQKLAGTRGALLGAVWRDAERAKNLAVLSALPTLPSPGLPWGLSSAASAASANRNTNFWFSARPHRHFVKIQKGPPSRDHTVTSQNSNGKGLCAQSNCALGATPLCMDAQNS